MSFGGPRRFVLVLLSAAMMLAGCGSGGSSSSEATPSDTPTSSTDPWALPQTIDVAYVQRVVNEIEEQRDFYLDDIHSAHQFSKTTEDRIRAIYVEPYLSEALQGASESSMKEHPELKDDTAPSLVPVKSIRSGSPTCISAVVDVDDSPGLKEPGKVVEFVVTLRRAKSVAESNITQWQESNWDGTSGASGKKDRCAEG